MKTSLFPLLLAFFCLGLGLVGVIVSSALHSPLGAIGSCLGAILLLTLLASYVVSTQRSS